MPGIFACGDVRFSPVKRVASAVGEGSMAIAFVHQYLRHQATRQRASSASDRGIAGLPDGAGRAGLALLHSPPVLQFLKADPQ